MKSLCFMLFIGLLTQLDACANHMGLSRLTSNTTPDDRRLVVTFVDRSINQKLPGNALDDHRNRGEYGNSGWSERLAHELAERHHILLVAQWPITSMGISCVVFEVPETLQLQQVMADLQNDREVKLVQPMQRFEVL